MLSTHLLYQMHSIIIKSQFDAHDFSIQCLPESIEL